MNPTQAHDPIKQETAECFAESIPTQTISFGRLHTKEAYSFPQSRLNISKATLHNLTTFRKRLGCNLDNDHSTRIDQRMKAKSVKESQTVTTGQSNIVINVLVRTSKGSKFDNSLA